MISILAMPVTDLERCLRYRKQFVSIDDTRQYKRLRIQLHGQGIVLRDVVEGLMIKTKQQQVVQVGDLVVAEIDAKLGGIGIVPQELDGGIVSNHYFIYEIDESILLRSYIKYFIRAGGLEVQVKAQGSTNYAAIRPQQVLGFEIPLPPLEEQRRIVARIDALANKIEEARGLRQETVNEVERLVAAEEIRIWPDENLGAAVPLEDVTTYLSRGRQSAQGESSHYLIKTQHVQMGQYVRSHMTLSSEAASKVSQEAYARPSDILIACSAAGCLGRVAYYTDTDRIASTDTHVAIARSNTRLITPEYLYFYLRGAQGQKQLRSREQGDWTKEKVGFRLAELNLADLKRVPVPLPTIKDQQRIVKHLRDLYTRVGTLKQLQSETAAGLDALLPSVLNKAFRGQL